MSQLVSAGIEVGQSADLIVMYEAGAFHAEKLPLFGGVHPTGNPQRPPDGRQINAMFADGHVKVYRLGFRQPSWNGNHDMNWVLYGGGGNLTVGKDFP